LSVVISSALALCLACSESPSTQNPTFPSQAGTASAGTSATGGSSSAGSASAGDGGNAAQVGGTGGSAQAGSSAGGAGGSATGGAGGSAPVTFKDGAVAAVSLTYDDGLDPHLAIVQPALEAAGFRGTFFLSSFEGVDNDWALPTTKMPLPALSPRHMAWQAAGQKGHELADHTVNHPCNSDSKAPGFHYTDYTMTRMQQELDDSIARLARLGAAPPLTFGYPCGGDKAGVGPTGEDFSPLVAERFLAARVSVSGIADPATVDLLHVPQLDTGGKTGDELKKMIDDAIAAKGWLVLLFHGVGNEQASCPQNLGYAPDKCMINYLTTSAEAHQTLVDYLAEKKQQVWTATFKDVATAIKTARGE
jgi:peptidoglycan/xylan/chitin deacetylase (PgdA/CDA1 family)